MKETDWWRIIGFGVGAFIATLLIHQLREPWETAVAISLAWMVGIYFLDNGQRKP